MPNQMVEVVCDGSFYGILTVVYMHYYDKIDPVIIRDLENEDRKQLSLTDLFAAREDVHVFNSDSSDGDYYTITVETDSEKAERVLDALYKKTSDSAYQAYLASLSPDNIYMDIYNYILLCFKVGIGVDDYKTIDYVLSVQKTGSYVSREAHRLKGFCRFAETKMGVLYCNISPVNNVVHLLAEHFQDRLGDQGFIIHDIKRGIAAIYDTKSCIVREVGHTVKIDCDEEEYMYQSLWSEFYKTIANQSRVNKKLHRQMLPLRFRPHLTEFKGVNERKGYTAIREDKNGAIGQERSNDNSGSQHK